MVICKYFLRGACRFGESCKNEHSYNAETTTSSVMRKKGEIDINVLIKSVSNDMDKAEKGNQWPLSCYGPFQAKPCFPGFEDKCFEEIRLGMYEAEKNGTVEQYKQQLTQFLHEARMKMRSLQNPTAEASHVLQELYNSNSPEQQTSNVFNTNAFSNSPIQSNSVFNNTGQATAKSIFQNQSPPAYTFAVPENKSIFANTAPNTNSIFAQANQQQSFASGPNIFAQQQQQQQQPNQSFSGTNIFKTANQSIFGSQQPNINQSPFVGAQPTQTSNIFMQNNQPPNPFKQNIQPVQQQSPFVGINQPTFINQQQQQQPPPTFATQINQPQPSFATVANQSPFAATFTPTANQTPFAPPPNQSVFPPTQPTFVANQSPFAATAPPVNQSPFAAAPNTQTFVPTFASTAGITENRSIFVQNSQTSASDHSRSIFGSSQSTVVAPVQRHDDPTIYSKQETLTENDVRNFEANAFEFGKIPDKPPTLQMCS